MELDEDEYVGEEVSALYDQEHQIVMLQRNRNSLSPSGIEKYFTRVLSNGDLIELAPIPIPDELRRVKQNQIFRKLTINFAPTNIDDELLDNTNKSIMQIIRGSRNLGALQATIILSLGNSSNIKTLKQDEIIKLGNLKNYDGFKRIQVNRREEEDTAVETVDLISGKLKDAVAMEVSKTNPITYTRLVVEMHNLYISKKNLMKSLFEEE